MRFRYKDTKEEFIPNRNEVLTVNDDGKILISRPYIGDELCVVHIANDLEIWEE